MEKNSMKNVWQRKQKVPPYDYYADTLDQAADWILKQDQETAVRERGGAYQEAVYTPGTEDSRSRKER